jgi:hypothetical protein
MTDESTVSSTVNVVLRLVCMLKDLASTGGEAAMDPFRLSSSSGSALLDSGRNGRRRSTDVGVLCLGTSSYVGIGERGSGVGLGAALAGRPRRRVAGRDGPASSPLSSLLNPSNFLLTTAEDPFFPGTLARAL